MSQPTPDLTPAALHSMTPNDRRNYQRTVFRGLGPLDGQGPKNRLYLAVYNNVSNPIWKLLICTPQEDSSGRGTAYGIVARPRWEFLSERPNAVPVVRLLLTEVNDYFTFFLESRLRNCADPSQMRYTEEWCWLAIQHLQDYGGYYGYILPRVDLEPRIRSGLSNQPYQPGQPAPSMEGRPGH
ncbi:hypothetical protein CALCODRAFT_508766 [Calocera cornea HHB12733]|uniref:Uncharacterized protein n=1 Tax=Calocera cornea HHB12733 TaxID=1353952 RepID=A0A165G0H2_9BASI|nr:hypothetical protein CALCODRAFT_508766 [Calocera cornea HHB12733]